MELVNPVAPAVAWWDRMTGTKAFGYQSNPGPHADTVRWTYTVPAGRKAMAVVSGIRVYRQNPAAPNGTVIARVVVTPSGGGASDVIAIREVDNTGGITHMVAPSAMFTLAVGDLVEFHTSDAGTGGNCTYSCGMVVSEFTA